MQQTFPFNALSVRLLFTLTFLWVVPLADVHAQGGWRVSRLGVDEGLSQGYVYAIHQDKKGFIWIGTHGGLNRYDGYNFKVFQYSPFDSTTLADNAVFFLREDPRTGKFWIGGSSALNEFDPTSFINVRYPYSGKQLEFADGIFVNPTTMLLACEYAVFLFDTRLREFKELPVLNAHGDPVDVVRVENVATDSNGNFMVMSASGVFIYDSLSQTCKRKTSTSPDFSFLDRVEVFDVLHDSRNDYWIATQEGLIRFNSRSNERVNVLRKSTNVVATRFDKVVEDSSGNIWAGSSRGLFRINATALKMQSFGDIDDVSSLSHAEVNAIYEDRNHFMWIGTVGDGLSKMVPVNRGFKHFDLVNDHSSNMGSYIMAIQELNDDIWFANIWDQVGKINRRTGVAKVLSPDVFSHKYRWYSEGALILDGQKLWLLNVESQYRITPDENGAIRVGARPSAGVCYLYRAKNGRLLAFAKAPVDDIVTRNDTIYGNQLFYDVTEDKAGLLWIGTNKGLVKYDPSTNTAVAYRHDLKNINTPSSDYIYSLTLDDKGETLWMAAYNGGLCSYHIPSNSFHHFRKEDGLADNTVYAIEKDQHNNLWFSSNAGITAFNPATGTIRNYGVQDGLLNYEFNRRSSFSSSDGWLFFGGVLGIDYFHPDSIEEADLQSGLMFTNFSIANVDYIAPDRDGKPFVELSPDNRLLTIEFSSLIYSDQQKAQYAYRLNGSDWATVGNQNVLSFSRLPVGEHELFVRSTNNEGAWLDNEIGCVIVVHPWWWQSTWFRIALACTSALLIVATVAIYYRRKLEHQSAIMEKKQAIERERTRIATDMHDDLGANLSRIKFLSETIDIKVQRQQSITCEINSIRQYSHEIINKMGEIVWALNEKHDSLTDLVVYMRAFAVEYLLQNGIETDVQLDDAMPDGFVSGEFRRNVFLTMKEAVHNIVKHAAATHVTITIQADRELRIVISDNGRGMRKDRRYGNGIANMKHRMTTLGGGFEMEQNFGTTIKLTAPLF